MTLLGFRFGRAQNGIWVKMSTPLDSQVNLGLYLGALNLFIILPSL